MVKPELVEEGGGFDGEITVLNHNYQQRLFTKGMGTSFSAPKIAHYLARLFNKYPMHHRNLIKCLLLSSTNFPLDRPQIFPKLNSLTKVSELQTLLNIYGYGKPNIVNALNTTDDRVALKFEGSMGLNQVKYFTIALPNDFVSEKGNRNISISLVYDPPIRQTRADYFGVGMEFHLFRNISLDDVKEKFNQVDLEHTKDNEEEEGKTPKSLQKYEITLKPGIKIRKKTPHQHGKVTLSTSSKLENKHPLVLAVITQKKWQFPNSFRQSFAVVVTLKHAKEINLYNQIRLKNEINIQTRVTI